MQDLTLVGLTEDKSKLLLVSDSGEEYAVPADTRLRGVLSGERARLGQLEKQMESALRPRDIQARIRAGESPEAVALAAETTVDRIMGYATPVLAERAHIADRAQRSSVRRKAGEGPSRLLGDAVADRLGGRNINPETVQWDAWRRGDGRWTLVADYQSGESSRHAEFVYDGPGRYVVADDDEARWLVGEESSNTAPKPAGGSKRRLSAVSAEEELPLGADAIDMVSDSPAEAEENTINLSRSASPGAGKVRRRPAEPDDPTAISGDADWIATQASERPASSSPARDEETPAAAEGPPEEAEPHPAAKRPTRKSRARASVPSWDEIMFGGGKSE